MFPSGRELLSTHNEGQINLKDRILSTVSSPDFPYVFWRLAGFMKKCTREKKIFTNLWCQPLGLTVWWL